MKKLFSLFFVATIFSLTGCERAVVESTKVVTYKIIDVKRPKHFRVSLQDETGRIYKKVSVSKHCNRWREVKVGSTVRLTTDIMKRGEDRWIDIHARSICPGK